MFCAHSIQVPGTANACRNMNKKHMPCSAKQLSRPTTDLGAGCPHWLRSAAFKTAAATAAAVQRSVTTVNMLVVRRRCFPYSQERTDTKVGEQIYYYSLKHSLEFSERIKKPSNEFKKALECLSEFYLLCIHCLINRIYSRMLQNKSGLHCVVQGWPGFGSGSGQAGSSMHMQLHY